MAEAIKEAYSDLFLIKAHPTTTDKAAIEGKFKSFHNVSDHVASQMASTFFGLLALADMSANTSRKMQLDLEDNSHEFGAKPKDVEQPDSKPNRVHRPSLHYNVQIHLPASKDVEVYNAIFKSLKSLLQNRGLGRSKMISLPTLCVDETKRA